MNPNPLPRVSLAFVRRTIAVLIAFCRNVVTQMTGNTNFTTPTPPLADVTAAVDALEIADEAASGGSHLAILDRKAKKATLISLMRQLAAYVQTQSQSSKAVIISSGFHTTKVPAPVGPLPAPENLRLTQTGTTGQLSLRFNRVRGVTAGYTVQIAEDVEGPYTDYTTSNKTRLTITGLTPAKTYWVRVRANGALGPSGWSNPASAIAI
jgi:hypothetical protein